MSEPELTIEDRINLEIQRKEHPERYPILGAGQTSREYWAYWTPARLDLWRLERGLT